MAREATNVTRRAFIEGAIVLPALAAGAVVFAEDARAAFALVALFEGVRLTTTCLVLPFDRAATVVRDFPLPAYLPFPPLLLATSVRIGCLISTISARTAELVSFSTIGDTAGKTAVSPACSVWLAMQSL